MKQFFRLLCALLLLMAVPACSPGRAVRFEQSHAIRADRCSDQRAGSVSRTNCSANGCTDKCAESNSSTDHCYVE